MKVIERDYPQIYEPVNPLDRRDGRVPSWIEVMNEVGLEDYPRGQKKLFHSFYRAHRMLAIGKEKKGRRLMNALEGRHEFMELEARFPERLSHIVRVVRKKSVNP